jgi:hypothetical protein
MDFFLPLYDLAQARIDLEKLFPNLRSTKYEIKSPQCNEYNCISFAAGITDKRCWPNLAGYCWPNTIENNSSISAFVSFFGIYGYELSEDEYIEAGYEKLAIFVNKKDRVTHAARLDVDGIWKSKLGYSWDITHELHAIEGDKYGIIKVFMRRKF